MQPTTMTPSRTVLLAAAAVVLLFADVARADGAGGGRDAEAAEVGRARAGSIKVAAFFSILACGALGCLLPVLGRRAPALRADGDVFFLVKAFAAGVILATGFIHVLPDAFERLASDRLSAAPWREFPFAGFGAMVGAIGALVVDTLATGYFTHAHFDRTVVADDVEKHGAGGAPPPQVDGHEGHVHLHTHAVHGHAHGSKALVAAVGEDDRNTLVRHRVVSQVLELGIVVHSVIIGISLGVSEDPRTIKPLVVALSFHQMFEGMGLGGCIVQAKFKLRSIVTMVLFFCLTTPVAILIGVGVSKVYDESSPTALAVEGLLDAVAAGILVYMALVDLLAEDFTNPKVQSRGRLQLGTSVAMLVGAGLMSMLAKWA